MPLGTKHNTSSGAASRAVFVALLACAPIVSADEPSRLGRFFRFGGSSAPSREAKPNAPSPGPIRPIPGPAGIPDASGPASTPELPSEGPANRIAPQPRTARAATEADPILTRVSIGRSDNGSRFGMFLQIYADGTVLDSEGVHKVGHDAMRPILESLRQGDLYRLKGHCGNPSADFIETSHVVVYERALGRLRAYSFSYSGSGKGCDASVQRLNAALDALQARLNAPPAPTTASVLAPETRARSTQPAAASQPPALMPPPASVAPGRPESPKTITLSPNG